MSRPEVPDTATASTNAYADVHLRESPAPRVSTRPPVLVELFHSSRHLDCGVAGMRCVIGIVERRIPEGHDRIAHVFVDGPTALKNDLAQRTQQLVDEVRQLGCGHFFGDRREVSDVAKHQSEVALLAAKHEPGGIGDDLLDNRRSKITPECLPNLAALGLDLTVHIDRDPGEDAAERQRWIGWID